MPRRGTQNFVRHDIRQVQQFIKSGSQFLKTVRSFFANSVRAGKLSQDEGKAYFKEILHTVLFFGNINLPVIEPKSFFAREEFEQLSPKYPDVFQKYNTHLPTRPPYTVLLDAVVKIKGTNVDEVLKCLLNLIEQTVVKFAGNGRSGNVFVSTVISYCYFCDVESGRQETDKYFGASVSCKGLRQRQIMIDILCCRTWHNDIRLAVCIGNWYNQHALKFPPEVHSTAFKIMPPIRFPEDNQMPDFLETILRAPCDRCFVMFPNIIYHPSPETHDDPHWEYGNCAECESLSQLLYANQQIVTKRQILISPAQEIRLPELINLKRKRLNDNLIELGFNVEHGLSYYDPSV